MRIVRLAVLLSLATSLPACGDKDSGASSSERDPTVDDDTDTDTDADTDSDTDSDTDTDTDSDTDSDTDTDTDTDSDASVAVTLRLLDGSAVPDVTVHVGGASAVTDTSGAATIEGIAPGTPHVLTAWPQGLVELQASVQLGAGETLPLDLVVPAVETAAFTPNGAAADVTVGDIALSMPEGLSFTTGDGAAYTDAVELRAARLDTYDRWLAPDMLSPDGAGDWTAPEVFTVFELSAVGTVGGEDISLVPSDSIAVSMPGFVPDPSAGMQLEHFDKATGDWAVDGTMTYDAGMLGATVDHFTWWRGTTGAPAQYQGGILVSIREGGGALTAPTTLRISCTDASGGLSGTASFTVPAGRTYDRCEHVGAGSTCTVSIDGASETVTANNRCRCNWSRQQCESIQFDVAAAPDCGNGVVETGETCDDGGTVAGDGCDATCQTEAATCPCDGFTGAAMTQAYDDATALRNHDEIGCELNGSLTRFGEVPASDGVGVLEIRGDDDPDSTAEVSKAWVLGMYGGQLSCQTYENETVADQQAGLTADEYAACAAAVGTGLAHARLDATCPVVDTTTCPCAGFTADDISDTYDAAILLDNQEIGCFMGASQASFGEAPASGEVSVVEVRGDDNVGGAEVSRAWGLGDLGGALACRTYEGETVASEQSGLSDGEYAACLDAALAGMGHAGIDPTTCEN